MATWHGPLPLKGSTGPPGRKGDDGEQGRVVPGQQGLPGTAGATGAPGVGIPGRKGDDGEPARTIPGQQGQAGTNGTNGTNGTQGVPGRKGDDGEPARTIPGQQGKAGTNGTNGTNGTQGVPGRKGDDGEPAPALRGRSTEWAGGDLTGTYPNPTVAANAVTNPKAAQMATKTLKGNNTGGTANPADLTVTQAQAMLGVSGGNYPYNYLINGGMDFMQRKAIATGSPSVGSIGSTRTIYFDRWAAVSQGNQPWTITRQAGGPNSANYAKYVNQSGGNDKLLWYQMLEGVVSQALSNQQATVTFQAQILMVAGAVPNIIFGLLKWTGTLDSMPVLGSSWGSGAGSNPALSAGFTLIGNSVVTPNTSAWVQASYTVQLPTGINNLVPILYMDSQTNSSGAIAIAECCLSVSPQVVPWYPRLPQQELALCQRYYEKSYHVDTPPGTASAPNECISVVVNNLVANSQRYADHRYKSTKRTSPIITGYGYGGVSGVVSNQSGIDLAAGSNAFVGDSNTEGFINYNNAGVGVTTTGQIVIYHYTADAEF